MKNNNIMSHYLQLQEMEFPYLSRMSPQKDEKKIKIEQIYEYIKTGGHEDFISLIELSRQFDKKNHDYEKVELIPYLPGVAFSYFHVGDFSWPEHLAFSCLIAFEFRLSESEEYYELIRLAETFKECIVLRFKNHFNGITLVMDIGDTSYYGLTFPFEMINQFFMDNFRLSAIKSPYSIDHLTTLRYDPDVYYNIKTIGFLEMMKKWSNYGPKAKEFINQYRRH